MAKTLSLKRPTLTPEDLNPAESLKILEFLNKAESAEEIDAAIDYPDKSDVGIKLASKIIETKATLGGQFSDLGQLMKISQIGPERFTDIVSILTGKSDVGNPERVNFKYLVTMNPNYFGNLAESPFEPVKPMKSNTTYEELMCVGFNPRFDRLEAVVHIKKPSGYGGSICSNGTPEYVRFYVDWNNAGVWEDVGMVSFTAYNIPGNKKPLECDVSIKLDAKKKFCFIKNLPKVRAILSWNTPPTPGSPDEPPVWGNSVDARIQIDALKLFLIKDLIKIPDVVIAPEILQLFDLEKEVDLKVPKKLAVPELIQLYKDKGVPKHRFAFPQIYKIMEKTGQPLIKMPASEGKSAVATVALPSISPLVDLGFDALEIPGIVGELFPIPTGDTTYEELKCIGLDTKQDALAGVIKVKKPSGYSGNPCSAGSDEYVAFWVDWGDGAGWSYAGTTSVNVHDIKDMPAEGLYYSVFLPIDLIGRKQPCGAGPKVVSVRAILSWEVPPPSWNPNYIPRWGNRRHTLVHIPPGPAIEEGTHTPYISVVGSMSIDDIDFSTGLADGTSDASTASFTADDSPFGGVIKIAGHIAFPHNTFVGGGIPELQLKYRVFVRRSLPGEPWQQLTNSFNVKLTDQVGSTFIGPYTHKQMIDPDGHYTYMEDLEGNERRFVEGFVLAAWVTGASMSGIWEIRMEAYDPTNFITYPALNSNGTLQIIRVCLDNEWPESGINITGYTRGGVDYPAEACGTFRKGDIIHGTYSLTDEYFGSLSVWAEPTTPASGGKLCIRPGSVLCTPVSSWATPPSVTRSHPVVSPGGESGVWSLDTTNMVPCGYVIRVHGRDRAIVNGGYVGHYVANSVGFCLLKPE